jgi:hypothetical protein
MSAQASDLLGSALQGVMNSIDQLKANLQSQASTVNEVVKRIIGRGFTEFSQSTDIQQINGVSESLLDQFVEYQARVLQVPAEYKSQLKEVMESVVW